MYPRSSEMPSFTLRNFCPFGFFTYLVLFSYISKTYSVSVDLTELRNKVAKIKVNPRGNLWATGHFMGKKSVVDSTMPLQEDDATMSTIETALNHLQAEPDDLYQEIMKTAVQAQLDSHDIRTKTWETALLKKILENYIQSKRKW